MVDDLIAAQHFDASIAGVLEVLALQNRSVLAARNVTFTV
jgi:hypothetical protein